MNQRALQGFEKVIGQEHPSTLSSVVNIAFVLQAQGKYDEAEGMNWRALEWCEKVLGKEHPYTLTTIANLASVLQAQKEYDKAEGMNRRVLEVSERVLGRKHPRTLSSLVNLASVLKAQGKYDEAEEMNWRARDGRKEDPDALTSIDRPFYSENANDPRSGLVLDRHLEAHSEAKFDSGIGSMPDTLSNSKEQDDDKRSIRSIVTNASRVLLPLQEEKHLISAFVGYLCQDIVFHGDLEALDRISTRLSDLLKTFTLRLETSANSKTEHDAKEFVRQQRE